MNLKPNKATGLYVFENDLRLEDNRLFNQACLHAVTSNTALICLYCFQPWQFRTVKIRKTVIKKANKRNAVMGSARYGFLWQSLNELKHQLQLKGISLLVRIGGTEQVVSALQKQHQFDHIYHNQSVGFYENQQWLKLKKKFPNLTFYTAHSNSLFELNDLPFKVSEMPKHFTPFRKAVEQLSWPLSEPVIDCYLYHKVNELNHWSQIPSVADGQRKVKVFIGGAKAAQEHLGDYFASKLPSSYKRVRNQLLGWQNSTKFSPWLALGCVSPRQIMQQLKTYEANHGANESTYWIFFELLWREFFYWNALKQGAKLFQTELASIETKNSIALLNLWSQGQTGVPLIDACMHQLNHTGYLSNRGRQIAASFLIHEMGVDWRLGAGYFEQVLIDYDVASNWGNWQYIAGVGADPRGGRHFNVEKQQQTHDPDGKFIKQWSKHESTVSSISWKDLFD